MRAALETSFFVLLAAHVVHAVFSNRRRRHLMIRWVHVGAVITQTPLFAIACYLAVGMGAFSRQLVSPVYIALGAAAGHLIFCGSLLITHRNLRDVAGYFWDLDPLWRFLSDSPLVLMRFLTVAIGEELIWRVGAQTLMIGRTEMAALSITVIAVAFSIVHKHFFVNSFAVSAEFLGFALLLGALYYWTGSLILVIAIHAVRDIEIAYLEYQTKVEELGDEHKAMEEFEKSLLRRHPENA